MPEPAASDNICRQFVLALSWMGAAVPLTTKSTKRPAPARSKAARLPVDSPLSDFDTQLMLQVREGNSEAAGRLIRRNFKRVSAYISRIIRQQRAVEDLTNDVFLSVLAHARDYRPQAKFSTWVYRIATNRAFNYLKQSAKHKQVSTALNDREAGIPDRGDARPDRRLQLVELKRRVAEALGQLPVRQRAALTLFEYEAMPYEQIAEILDVSVESVRALLTRARADLRKRLGGLL